jgi:excinuclease UvrABC nuclease subunit
LRPAGKPGDPDWMGLSWRGCETLVPEKTRDTPADPGLYVLIDSGSQEIIYIGQSGNCANRLLDHSRKSWDEKNLQFSFHDLEKEILPHQQKELENDLIGNYFEMYRKAPEYQFGNST